MERIVIFDGVCNLCSRTVQAIIHHDRRSLFKFVPAQSALGRALLVQSGLDPEKLETFVLRKGDQAFTRSDAALEIAKELDWPWRMLVILRVIPRMPRDSLYNFVARHRYRWFGKKDQCMVPTDSIKSRFIG